MTGLNFTSTIRLLAVVLLTAASVIAQQRYTINGSVLDSLSGEPLAAVNIRVEGTTQGTIANARGDFTLSLPAGSATLLFSAIGYESKRLTVTMPSAAEIIIRLVQSPVVVPEVIVLAEDPAVDIIRKAIARKRSWMDKLKTYRFEAFTRQTLIRDTAIASITESYTTGFMSAGDTLREIIRQKRQTQNIPTGDNAAAVRSIVNFNEDEIRLFQINVGGNRGAYSFIGPTAPDALDHYNYRLIRTSTVDGIEVYTIRMIPNSNLRPLFDGIITIADGTFAVMGVDVKPNETLNIPFLRDIDLRYQQQFSLYDNVFWMPSDIRISGGFSVSLIGFTLPRIGIEQTSAIYEYALNVPIPDSMQGKPRVTADSAAATFDSLFWSQHEVLPLTERERVAYGSLDSTQTLEKQFEPRGPLAAMGSDEASGILGLLDIRFNRVEGFFTGISAAERSWIPSTELRVGAGFGFSDRIFKYRVGASWYHGKDRTFEIGADVYRRLGNSPDGDFYGPFAISIMSLVDRNDYRDYFLRAGWSTYLSFRPVRRITGTISYTDEQHYSMENATGYSLFGGQPYRSNPFINDGRFRSVAVSIRFGSQPIPLGIVSQDAMEFGCEYSAPGLLGSEFDFFRYWGEIEFGFTTFARSLLFPPGFRIRLIAGGSDGSIPVQCIVTLDTRASGFAPFGVLRGGRVKEFVGEEYVMVNAEHNFRSIPFLLLGIPLLYRSGIEVVAHGSYARVFNGLEPYAEAGIGISRIFDLFRADLTYRLTGQQGIIFSLGVATLF